MARIIQDYFKGITEALRTKPQHTIVVVPDPRSDLISALSCKMAVEHREELIQSRREELEAGRRQGIAVFMPPKEADVTAESKALTGYSLDTLQMLEAVFKNDGNLHSFMGWVKYFDQEKDVRAALIHAPNMIQLPQMYSDTRSALGVDDLSIAPEGSGEHEIISAVLTVAHRGHSRRKSKLYRTSTRVAREILRNEDERLKMSPELAAVIIQHLDRTDDIISFMDAHDQGPDNVDTEHLTLHLDSAARSLATGVL